MIFKIFCISLFLSAFELESFSDIYMISLNAWINAEISSKQMLKNLSAQYSELETQTVSWETYYWKSRISLLRGQIYFKQKENEQSIRELENCLELAGQANELNERSEILSTMAVASSLLMVQKGFLFIVSNFSVSQDQARRALELNPENPHALLVRAQFLCNAPPFVGGNFEKGINMLRALSEREGLSAADRFFILQSLAEIYRDNNRTNAAAVTCRKALTIFPGNRECRDILSKLDG